MAAGQAGGGVDPAEQTHLLQGPQLAARHPEPIPGHRGVDGA